ncbi:hypothetical protein ACFXPS_05950 [Nocardia sp. NPDC059091]|uniref:hypothetical protein n=1 Tax=unclassified Nocardia TaxID=2637762 RepID=UPI0036861FE5
MVSLKGPFDDVPALIGGRVEIRWPPIVAASPFPIRDLVGAFRNNGTDTFAAQQSSVARRRVRLLGEHLLGAAARRAAGQPGTAIASSTNGIIGESLA